MASTLQHFKLTLTKVTKKVILTVMIFHCSFDNKCYPKVSHELLTSLQPIPYLAVHINYGSPFQLRQLQL